MLERPRRFTIQPLRLEANMPFHNGDGTVNDGDLVYGLHKPRDKFWTQYNRDKRKGRKATVFGSIVALPAESSSAAPLSNLHGS
jgi:hypothetical protein